MAAIAIRTLHPSERGVLLDLLDLWPLADGWRGRDFFRRYVEADPTFADENVWVASRDGRLVACAQIFPRLLRVRVGASGPTAAVPTGGIGSVFTHPEARGGGIASGLLARCREAMRARGMELSLLFASRHDFYRRLGWALFEGERLLLLRGAATHGLPAGACFDAGRDLDAVARLHAAYSSALEGTVVRDAALWRASLRCAGNPSEDFVVRRDGFGRLLAYARGCRLEGVYVLSEWARGPDAASVAALAELVAGLMQPRDPDPLAGGDRSSAALRGLLVAPPARDHALVAALAARGVERRSFTGRDAMLCCLDADALARRIGVARGRSEPPEAFLTRVLPPERLSFWPADRF